MKYIYIKAISLIVYFLYPSIPIRYRYFLRYKILSNIYELKNICKDYFYKKKYKIIEYDREFGPELLSVLPFAYWHYKNGTLLKTISSEDSSPFYFFSKNHEEKFSKRIYDNPIVKIPNSENHVFRYNLKKWKKVPLKDYYTNNEFIFDKPILVISNKYNLEWGEQPINFIDNITLHKIFQIFNNNFQIIYNRPQNGNISPDNSRIFDLNDFKLIKENFPNIYLIQDFLKMKPNYSYNQIQLLIYSNCSHFISVQGGNSVLCSYFGGTNIIFAKKGLELYFKEYNNIYPLLSNAKIVHVNNYDSLVLEAKRLWQSQN